MPLKPLWYGSWFSVSGFDHAGSIEVFQTERVGLKPVRNVGALIILAGFKLYHTTI